MKITITVYASLFFEGEYDPEEDNPALAGICGSLDKAMSCFPGMTFQASRVWVEENGALIHRDRNWWPETTYIIRPFEIEIDV